MPEPSRREFLLQTAAIAGSLIAARGLPLLGEETSQPQSSNPMLLWYSQEARAYSLLALLCALSLLYSVRALRRSEKRGRSDRRNPALQT